MAKQSKSAEIKEKIKNKFLALLESDKEFASSLPEPSVKDAVESQDLRADRMIDLILSSYADRPALGERQYELHKDEVTGLTLAQYTQSFETITYKEVQDRLHAIASAWKHHPVHNVGVDEFVCIIGFTSTDFFILDTACVYAQAVPVPLQSSTSGADLDEIIANTAPATIAATIADLEVAAQLAANHEDVNGGIKSLVAFDYDGRISEHKAIYERAQEILTNSGVKTELIAMKDLLEYGKTQQWEYLPDHPEGAERLGAILHSSGSTGKPKGAMLAEAATQHTWESMVTFPSPLPVITVAYAPYNHLLGRSTIIGALAVGGAAHFSVEPDMSTLFDDIRIARPTRLSFFPRIFELIYQHFQNEVTRKVRNGEGSEEEVSEQVQAEMAESFLGNRLMTSMVAGAPTSPSVRKFIRECFDLLLVDAYGNTESGTGSIAFNGKIQSPPVTEYKLKDVPELGYYTTDKPYPRGELCYKSVVGIRGYYKQPEATADLFDEDGFSLTGDIVEERGPGHIVVCDRRKDVIKLSQGEYVAIGNLATQFESGSAAIKQIFLYGNPLQAYLVAVIVPDVDAVNSLIGTDWDEKQLKTLLADELQKVAKVKDIKSFEVPRDFIIEMEPFTQENGLLSSVRKRLGPALRKKYGERLEAIYEDHANKQDADLRFLKGDDCTLTTVEKIGKLLEFNLNREEVETSRSLNFTELGGDSLSAVSFSMAIEEVFGVALPADSILNPVSNATRWAKAIDKLLSGDADGPTFETIHGKSTTTIKAEDLKLSAFFDDSSITQNVDNVKDPSAPERAVLLTGANGFLGRFVCLDWLKKLAKVDGQLICLVRASDTDAAKSRLDAVFAGDCEEIEANYHRLAEKHLRVVCGDVSEPLFGLEQGEYEALTQQVDRVVHVAAFVNHKVDYSHMFGPNVVGTAEVIRFALSSKKKAIDFVSTVAAIPFLDLSKGFTEDSPLLDTVQLLDFYAAGYGASKWAGELLLKQANRDHGLNVNVFRGDLMLPHQSYKAQINTDDMFTRLLFSVVTTGLAPESFYQLLEDGSKAKAHYNGVPVDVVSATIVNAGDSCKEGFNNFHIVNYHEDDGCSLDAFVDWLEELGYPISRLEHGTWFDRFQQKLEGLSDEKKQLSSLAILSAFAMPYPSEGSAYPSENFKALMEKLPTELPHLDKAYIGKCLADMQVKGLIESPELESI